MWFPARPSETWPVSSDVRIYTIYKNSYEASRLNNGLDAIYSKMHQKAEDNYYPSLSR